MSSQDAKNKETESKIMGAAEAVTALIDAVTKESADGVRAAAERFKKDTKSDVKTLGDANGRTPLHLVRVPATETPRRPSPASGAGRARSTSDRRRRSRARLEKKPSPRQSTRLLSRRFFRSESAERPRVRLAQSVESGSLRVPRGLTSHAFAFFTPKKIPRRRNAAIPK